MPDSSGLGLGILLVIIFWSIVISGMSSQLLLLPHVPRPRWRIWLPIVLAWSWPFLIAGFVVSMIAAEGTSPWWAAWLLLLIPLPLVVATVWVAMEFRYTRLQRRAISSASRPDA